MSDFNTSIFLDDKEQRYQKQCDMITLYSLPIISFTINTPGTEKNGIVVKKIFSAGLQEIESVLSDHNMHVIDRYCDDQALSGPLALFSIDDHPVKIKELMIGIENSHPVGRLFDIDVMDMHMHPVSRIDFGSKPRKCLICDDDAKICTRSQRHNMADVLENFHAICSSYLESLHD